ncbi:DUF2326 domain-containing protein [Ochrobactrum sp. AN78]|uniref:DUF2326 domain-containing protein n=1 Tax=Ochrobactrum sp. AN78 TaxID=3039853 RepID=UPI002989EF0B|nr:DUF2326 domain-containing protein [Ochrobactrum sp. AN78]MDH7789154.1 uncharacterized protein YydD (DUF2326 family) [Ochrobactrum sp. AN78]
MIEEVNSSLPHFRTAYFTNAMNIVLADTVADSHETESTNGLGKTTLIRIIHFCLGGSLNRDRILSHPSLHGVTFGLVFNYKGEKICVNRKVGEDSVDVSVGFIDGLEIKVYARTGEQVRILATDWTRVLSHRFTADTFVPHSAKYIPSFRDVFLYQARVGKDAYTDPQQAFRGQSGPQRRIVLSYLLYLNWDQQRILYEDQHKREQISNAIKALKDAEDSADEISIGELEAERVVLENDIAEKREEVAGFNVRSDYTKLENRLYQVDLSIHDAVNQNHSDQRLLEYYLNNAKDVPSATAEVPLKILSDAGAIFREEALRSLAEVATFHEQVYRNRREFLATEILRLRAEIRERSGYIDTLSIEKTELLRSLKSSGALDTLILLQRGLTELEAAHDSLKARIDERKRFDVRKDVLSASMIATRALLKRDLEDRRPIIDEVLGLFSEYTKFLYGRPGKLGIDVKQAGYSLSITIDREGSDGVDQMVVFCLDLVIATIRARRNTPFSVLIHDSTMFADVDPRQYGLALQLAASTSAKEGFQYICCLNAGALPKDHLGDFVINDAIRLRLTDDGDTGRLLGMKLPPRER